MEAAREKCDALVYIVAEGFKPPERAALLLSIEDMPKHIDLSRRKLWTGVVLEGDEIALASERIAHADADVAAHLVVHLSRKHAK